MRRRSTIAQLVTRATEVQAETEEREDMTVSIGRDLKGVGEARELEIFEFSFKIEISDR